LNRFTSHLFLALGLLLVTESIPSTNQLLAQKQAAQDSNSKTNQRSNAVPFALSPATVRVILNVNPHVVNSAMRQQLREEVARRLQNSFGQSIHLKLETSFNQFDLPVSVPKVSPSPNKLDALNQSVIVLYLDRANGKWQIRTKSWLALTDQWTELPQQSLKNPQAIARYLTQTVSRLIASVMKIDEVEQKTVAGILAGGEFLTPDESISLLQQGEFLGVVMLYFDRERKLKARQILPWTYLKVTERNRALITCQTISAFRNPIPKSRRRVEVLAYRINSPYPKTKARVMIRDKSNRPFRLTKVFLSKWETTKAPAGKTSSADKTSSAKGEKKTQAPPIAHLELTTTREGILFLSQKEIEKTLGSGLIKIEVMSDKSVVARVPWLPGSTAELEITVPDDSARLDARLRLKQLETELLRVTAKRATIIAALKQLANNPREVDPALLFQEIKKLPSREYFMKQIRLIQVTATDLLLQKGNRTAARDVRKLCEKTEAIVDRHLDEEPIDELKLRLGFDEESSPKK